MKLFTKIMHKFGFYDSDIRTIEVTQFDGLKYTIDVHKDDVNKEIRKNKLFAKTIKIL